MKSTTKLLATSAIALSLVGGFALTAQAQDLRPADIVKLANDGTIKPFDQLDKIATDLHPGSTIRDADIDNKHGRIIYEVELVDAQGVEWDIDIDAKTGEVVQNKRD